MKLVPLNPNFLAGVAIFTCNPDRPQLYFLGPVLSSRGNELREARKVCDKYTTDRQAGETVDEGQERESMITLCIASLKQQYKVTQDDGKKLHEDADADEAWREAFADHYTDDDLHRIAVSMRLGKELKQSELFEMAQKEGNKIAPNPTK